MPNEISYDWVNNVPKTLGPEGQDINGNPADNKALPDPAKEKNNNIAPESQLPADNTDQNDDENNVPAKLKPVSTPPANNTKPQPKAVMPPHK